MTKTVYVSLFISILILSCGQQRDSTMSFANDNIDRIGHLHTLTPSRWYKTVGNISVDSVQTYKGEKSLRLKTSEDDSTKRILASFLYDFEEIEGDTLIVEGKYKILKANDAKISFRIVQYGEVHNKLDSVFIELVESPEWKNFKIKTALREDTGNAFFYIFGQGDIDILLSNCHTWVDNIPLSDLINREFAAEKDTEFDNGSRIELGELTPQMVENLEVLGKVWGFLKYYHPEVTQGKYNWDYELFRVLPRIANANDRDQRNRLLNRWIDKYGKIKETVDYTIPDSTKYSRFIDLGWLEDRDIFDEQLIIKFQHIKSARRSKKLNYYIVPYRSGGWPDFKQERSYESIEWDDQGFRILTLFRLWNAIEYCFPYIHYTDTPWNTLLKDFIPKFVFPDDQISYELAIMALGAKIDDSHGYIQIPNNRLIETVLAPIYVDNRIPIELTQSREGYIVVKKTGSELFHLGDIIVSIDGKDIRDIIEKISPYIAASNRNGLIRNISRYLMSTPSNEMYVEVIRNGERIEIHVTDFKWRTQSGNIKSWRDYNLEDRDIIHVDNIKSNVTNRDIVQNNMNSKGLIIDMRVYPHQVNHDLLPPLLLSKYPLWISENDKSGPGNYRIMPKYDKIIEPEKDPNYKGKIVILVDENTQSAGETWAMEHRLAPNSIMIGRQTAGANGNIGRIYLPGGIEFKYTQLGAYYPDWEILQREGVKIDIPVSPTVDDIKAGRDVWIEKAIEIIENK